MIHGAKGWGDTPCVTPADPDSVGPICAGTLNHTRRTPWDECGLTVLAVLGAANDQTNAGLFDRLAQRFGGEPVALQSDGPTPARPAPILVPPVPVSQTQEAPPLPVPGTVRSEPEPIPIELYPHAPLPRMFRNSSIVTEVEIGPGTGESESEP